MKIAIYNIVIFVIIIDASRVYFLMCVTKAEQNQLISIDVDKNKQTHQYIYRNCFMEATKTSRFNPEAKILLQYLFQKQIFRSSTSELETIVLFLCCPGSQFLLINLLGNCGHVLRRLGSSQQWPGSETLTLIRPEYCAGLNLAIMNNTNESYKWRTVQRS